MVCTAFFEEIFFYLLYDAMSVGTHYIQQGVRIEKTNPFAMVDFSVIIPCRI